MYVIKITICLYIKPAGQMQKALGIENYPQMKEIREFFQIQLQVYYNKILWLKIKCNSLISRGKFNLVSKPKFISGRTNFNPRENRTGKIT